MSNKLFLQIAALILLAGIVIWAVLKSQQPAAHEPPDPTANVSASVPWEMRPPTEAERRHTAEIMNQVMNDMRGSR
jgi:hypothetical protein